MSVSVSCPVSVRPINERLKCVWITISVRLPYGLPIHVTPIEKELHTPMIYGTLGNISAPVSPSLNYESTRQNCFLFSEQVWLSGMIKSINLLFWISIWGDGYSSFQLFTRSCGR